MQVRKEEGGRRRKEEGGGRRKEEEGVEWREGVNGAEEMGETREK